MQWQPIETAPKVTGNSIILLINGGVIEARWVEWASREGTRRGEWETIVLPSHGCGCCSREDPEPTHWMPLPEPPSAE